MSMSTSLPQPQIYHPLPPRFIRIFELEPGNVSDPIVGRMVFQPIDGESYEAVSYVWGDTSKRHDIYIDGAPLSITMNLHGALMAFRRPPSTDQAQKQVRRLWADAVCINQADLSERTSQVELMGHIFARARRVLAWLGWEEGNTTSQSRQTAINFIYSFMDRPEQALRRGRILLSHDMSNPAENLNDLPEVDRRVFHEQSKNWIAIKRFFEIEYFHRVWIVQEVGLAREAVLYTALKPFEVTDDKGPYRTKSEILNLHSIDWQVVGQFVKFLDLNAASLVTHLGLLIWVAHHIVMIWEKKEDGSPACDFLTAMHWARILGVTDARDRVYSLLGHPLAVMDGDLVIKPDYTVTRGVVYTKLAATFIRKTKNLYVVNLVDHEVDPILRVTEWDPSDEQRMPTWVPDWHSINRTTPMPYPVPAAEEKDLDIRIEGDLDGRASTPMPHLLVRGWVVDKITAVSRRMETTDFPVTNLARERTKVNPFWLDVVWDLISSPKNSANFDALTTLETLSLALPLGVREEGQPESSVGPQQAPDQHHKSFAAYVLEYHNLWLAASKDRTGDTSHLPACSLYDSLPKQVQDEITRRGSGVTSELFVESMTWPSMCRIVYKTVSGLVGLGSRISKPGDLVCRVQGSPVLMTLRPIEEPRAMVENGAADVDANEPIVCAHIGPTVVPARMKKDVINGEEFGEKAAKFWIL